VKKKAPLSQFPRGTWKVSQMLQRRDAQRAKEQGPPRRFRQLGILHQKCDENLGIHGGSTMFHQQQMDGPTKWGNKVDINEVLGAVRNSIKRTNTVTAGVKLLLKCVSLVKENNTR
jgi:hypothetical protein